MLRNRTHCTVDTNQLRVLQNKLTDWGLVYLDLFKEVLKCFQEPSGIEPEESYVTVPVQ
jgi:hypothetical protein